MPEKKGYISVSKGVHKQKLGNLRKSYRIKELYIAFKEKHTNVNIALPKVCAWRPKWCVLAGSKMTHSLCICSANQNVVLLVDAMYWDMTYQDLMKSALSCLKYFHYSLFAITFISPSFERVFFFNWNITSSPYLEMIKLLLLFFLTDRNVWCRFL